MLRSKNVFKSMGALSNITGLILAIYGWYQALPPDLGPDTIEFIRQSWQQAHEFILFATVNAAALWGRWRATVPLHLFKKKSHL